MDEENHNHDLELLNTQKITQQFHNVEFRKGDFYILNAHASLIVLAPMLTIGATVLFHWDAEVMKGMTGFLEGFAFTGLFANTRTESPLAHASTHWLDMADDKIDFFHKDEEKIPFCTRSKILRKLGNILPFPVLEIIANDLIAHQNSAFLGVSEFSTSALLGHILHRHYEEFMRMRRNRRRENSESFPS